MNRLGWVLGLLVVGCASSSKTQSFQPEVAECGPDRPTGTVPPPLKPPVSRLGATLQLSPEALAQEIEHRVPRTLGKERGRSIGAPGRVDYTIRRDAVVLGLAQDRLNVTTELLGDIRLCKPFGRFCPQYGSCRPTWHVRISAPLDLAWDAPPNVTTQVQMAEGCILSPVRFDATPQLKEITRKQARRAGARIRRDVARAHAQLLQLWKEQAQSLEFTEGQCVRHQVDELAYAVQDRGTTWDLLAEARGSLSVGDCQADEPTPETPKTHREQRLNPGVELTILTPVPFDAITTQLAARGEGLDPELLSVTGLQGTTLYAGLRWKDCDRVWLPVQATLENGELVLSPDLETQATSTQKQAGNWLLTNGRLRLPDAGNSATKALQHVKSTLQRQVRRLAQVERATLKPNLSLEMTASVAVGARQLGVLQTLNGKLHVIQR